MTRTLTEDGNAEITFIAVTNSATIIKWKYLTLRKIQVYLGLVLF